MIVIREYSQGSRDTRKPRREIVRVRGRRPSIGQAPGKITYSVKYILKDAITLHSGLFLLHLESLHEITLDPEY
jgi:hypothetical protein